MVWCFETARQVVCEELRCDVVSSGVASAELMGREEDWNVMPFYHQNMVQRCCMRQEECDMRNSRAVRLSWEKGVLRVFLCCVDGPPVYMNELDLGRGLQVLWRDLVEPYEAT